MCAKCVTCECWFGFLVAAICMLMVVHSAEAASGRRNLIKDGSFENGLKGAVDAGWDFGDAAEIVTDQYAASGKSYIGFTGDAGSALFKWIEVKPNTGYIAKCKVSAGGGGHLTLGIRDSATNFIVCRDTFAVGAKGEWSELVLPFRSQEHSKIALSVGKRYGGSVFFDQIELYEDDSVQTGDVSPKPRYRFPKLTAAEIARGYVVSQPDYTEIIYPTYYLSRSRVAKKLECAVTPGDREAITMLVSAQQPLGNVRVSLAGELKSKRGAVIPAANVDVRMVRYIDRWLTNGEPLQAGQRYERRPAFLFPAAPVSIEESESQQFWLTVHAPSEAAAGVYSGAVRISTDNSAEYLMPINIRVLPFKLADSEITYGMYYRPHEQHPEYISAETFASDMRDMREHGMNSISVYAMVERRDNYKVDFDFQPSPQRLSLNRLMEIADGAGLLNRRHPVLYLPEDHREYMYLGKEETVKAIKTHEKLMGWPELLFYIGDEPSLASIPRLEKITSMIHNVPNVRTVTAGVNAGPLGEPYDVWISSVYEPNLKKVAAEAYSRGKECWLYDCQMGGMVPVNERYIAGLLPWASDINGVWQWCYAEPANGGKVNQSGEIELVYPFYESPWGINYIIRDKDQQIPTIGWEVRREGIDDYRYILTLEKLIANIENSPNSRLKQQASEAKAYLENVAKKARRDKLGRSVLQVENTYVTEYNPKIKPTDYAKIRKRVIEHILKLQK